MNLLDDMPTIGRCPLCGHAGDGLQFAIPDDAMTGEGHFTAVQVACLSCGTHSAARPSYAEAIEAFRDGDWEEAVQP